MGVFPSSVNVVGIRADDRQSLGPKRGSSTDVSDGHSARFICKEKIENCFSFGGLCGNLEGFDYASCQ